MKTKIILPVLIILTSLVLFFSCKKDKGDKDTTAPVITMKGDSPYYFSKDSLYVDPGATALDETDGDITSKIAVINNVNTTVIGTYQVKYNVSDNAGNAAAEVVRTVDVIIMK
jgi:hypothetical protein